MMILCSKKCKPSCDFCIYAIHEKLAISSNDDIVLGGPIDCKIHKNEELVSSSWFCNDFHCFKV